MSFDDDDLHSEIESMFDSFSGVGQRGLHEFLAFDDEHSRTPTRKSFTIARSASVAVRGDERVSQPVKKKQPSKGYNAIMAAGKTIVLREKEKREREMCRRCLRQGQVLMGGACVVRNSCKRYVAARLKTLHTAASVTRPGEAPS